jgi:hypothetical protein
MMVRHTALPSCWSTGPSSEDRSLPPRLAFVLTVHCPSGQLLSDGAYPSTVWFALHMSAVMVKI